MTGFSLLLFLGGDLRPREKKLKGLMDNSFCGKEISLTKGNAVKHGTLPYEKKEM